MWEAGRCSCWAGYLGTLAHKSLTIRETDQNLVQRLNKDTLIILQFLFSHSNWTTHQRVVLQSLLSRSVHWCLVVVSEAGCSPIVENKVSS